VERFKNKRVLVVGIGKTGFSLINFFNNLDCDVRVTDILPIFELNKSIKRLKKIKPVPTMTFGEHKDEDFLDADVVVYGSSVDRNLPQLELARLHGKQVYGQFELCNILCKIPLVIVCGSRGRTTVSHMIGYTLRLEGKNVFVGGSSQNPFINMWVQNQTGEKVFDYAVIEVSAEELSQFSKAKPALTVYTNLDDGYNEKKFKSYSDFVETQLSVVKNLTEEDYLIVNYDRLMNNVFFKEAKCQTYWYSRRSYVNLGVDAEIFGTHFHDRRVHSNIHGHSDFKVTHMRIIGEGNRENLLAAVTACKALKVSDRSIQTCIEKFPGIPHRLEFVMEKNGVKFYNDSKSETMPEMMESLKAFKAPVILIAGGKDTEQNLEPYFEIIEDKVRVLVLVGECKEKLNRTLGDASQTYLVGSFEESILIAYQKSRTGDMILLSPGSSSTDIFRDYEERGNYYKKLVYQL
jgi:UDP-N-acetylmuramoylalanine--D-glutamate ligase